MRSLCAKKFLQVHGFWLCCSLTPIGCIYLQEENVEQDAQSGIDPLTVSLYQMDLDRTQFLLRSYLRIRLQKVGCLLSSCVLFGCVSLFYIAFERNCAFGDVIWC